MTGEIITTHDFTTGTEDSNMKSVEEDPELWQEALSAWFKWCDRTGTIPDQPGKDESYLGTKYVYLRNVKGTLALYDIKKRVIVEETP